MFLYKIQKHFLNECISSIFSFSQLATRNIVIFCDIFQRCASFDSEWPSRTEKEHALSDDVLGSCQTCIEVCACVRGTGCVVYPYLYVFCVISVKSGSLAINLCPEQFSCLERIFEFFYQIIVDNLYIDV